MAADPHANVAPYALHALDEDESRDFEQHLAVCERCREELAGLKEAAAALAYGADGPAPPPELRDRILAQAREERPNVTSLPARRRSWTVPLAAAAAVAASVAIGLGVWTATRGDSGNAFTRVAAQPGARVIGMGSQGALAVATDGRAAFVLRVPRAPHGKTYEAWVIRGPSAKSAGLFGGGGGASVVALSRHVPRDAVVGVTVERAGGADQPTQKPFVTSAEQS